MQKTSNRFDSSGDLNRFTPFYISHDERHFDGTEKLPLYLEAVRTLQTSCSTLERLETLTNNELGRFQGELIWVA